MSTAATPRHRRTVTARSGSVWARSAMTIRATGPRRCSAERSLFMPVPIESPICFCRSYRAAETEKTAAFFELARQHASTTAVAETNRRQTTEDHMKSFVLAEEERWNPKRHVEHILGDTQD